jgi:hypothetical protein
MLVSEPTCSMEPRFPGWSVEGETLEYCIRVEAALWQLLYGSAHQTAAVPIEAFGPMRVSLSRCRRSGASG